ncbi:fimbria/pilus outer membrane usher protein [Pseudomonas donghuensis]|uniref:fimbria/pilus outer membrane usher protein n=1 Tax=Pseudomonas donghuensis TaxID=1163398 RepID=UPI002E0F4899|nr:fimbria/pilus outer membrane usher protein [Pseudomonas donghuensis]
MKVTIRPGANQGAQTHFALNSLVAVILGLALATSAGAEETGSEVIFNSDFLPAGSQSLDLTRYKQSNPVEAGMYRADVALNSKLVTRQDIRIQADKGGSNPYVCIDRKLLELMGVDMSRLDQDQGKRLAAGGDCLRIEQLIEGASANFSTSEQRLDLSIPQAALKRSARGYVSPELWDRGVTAGMLGYNFNTNHNRTDAGNFDSAYLGLSAGMNVGDWRLRHDGSATWQSMGGRDYQSINTYAQRDVTSLRSQLTLGEANTSGELFDSLAYRGAQLASDDRMLPESQRGYAPVIRGIARTTARVDVRQNGNLLYETTVAPGQFVIDDLYPTGYGGDLQVTVHEADGSTQRFAVPYASVSQLLRPGTTRYSLTAGKTRNQFVDQQASLLQGTVQRGLSNNLTGYGGIQSSDDYMAVMAGAAFGSPIGALALDITQAQADLPSSQQKGQSVRVTYNKNILSTGSNFALAAYRFSTEGYLDFNNALQISDAEKSGLDASLYGRPRSRLSLTANQSLGRYGQLSLSGFTQNYWNLPGSDVQYQAYYSTQWRDITFSLSANRSRAGLGDMQTSYLLSASMPLELSSRRAQLSARVSRDTNGKYSEQASLSGTAGQTNQLSYGVTAGRDGASQSVNTSLNAQYIGSKAMTGASISQGDGYQSASLNLSGTAIAHAGGLTLTPYQGETMAVVGAEGAAGAKVVGYPGLELDRNGYAVVPYLRPYELNEVAIDPNGTSLDLELQETSQQIAPRAGSVVMLKYASVSGNALVLRATLADGSPAPFGASVSDAGGTSVGVVGQDGQIYARVKDGTHSLRIVWGQDSDQQCGLQWSSDEKEAICRS